MKMLKLNLKSIKRVLVCTLVPFLVTACSKHGGGNRGPGDFGGGDVSLNKLSEEALIKEVKMAERNKFRIFNAIELAFLSRETIEEEVSSSTSGDTADDPNDISHRFSPEEIKTISKYLKPAVEKVFKSEPVEKGSGKTKGKDKFEWLKKAKLSIETKRPCRDNNGNAKDGSIYGREGTICVSVERLRKRVELDDANVKAAVYSLLAHEYSHLKKTTENEAEAIEIFTRATFSQVGEDYNVEEKPSLLKSAESEIAQISYYLEDLTEKTYRYHKDQDIKLEENDHVTLARTIVAMDGKWDVPFSPEFAIERSLDGLRLTDRWANDLCLSIDLDYKSFFSQSTEDFYKISYRPRELLVMAWTQLVEVSAALCMDPLSISTNKTGPMTTLQEYIESRYSEPARDFEYKNIKMYFSDEDLLIYRPRFRAVEEIQKAAAHAAEMVKEVAQVVDANIKHIQSLAPKVYRD
jgi:hypothetical protein